MMERLVTFLSLNMDLHHSVEGGSVVDQGSSMEEEDGLSSGATVQLAALQLFSSLVGAQQGG